MAALQQAVAGYDRFELAPDRFLEDDNTVVVVGCIDVAKGESSAVVPFIHLWTFRGEQIAHLQVLTDTYQLAEILGTA